MNSIINEETSPILQTIMLNSNKSFSCHDDGFYISRAH